MATVYLLDTNVVIQLIRGGPVGLAIERRYGLSAGLNVSLISIVTVGELFSFSQRNWGPQKCSDLSVLLESFEWTDILDYSILEAYAEIDNYSLSLGRTMGKNDIWIAATASAAGLTLLTIDRDFDHLQASHLSRILLDPESGLPTA